MNIHHVLRSREFAVAVTCLVFIAILIAVRSLDRAPGILHLTINEDAAVHIEGDHGVVVNCTRGTLVVDQDFQQPLVLLYETRDDIEYTHVTPR